MPGALLGTGPGLSTVTKRTMMPGHNVLIGRKHCLLRVALASVICLGCMDFATGFSPSLVAGVNTFQGLQLKSAGSLRISPKVGRVSCKPYSGGKRRAVLSPLTELRAQRQELQNQENSEKEEIAPEQSTAPPIGFNEQGELELFGNVATPEIWAISLVYFVQGITGISRLAVSFYYKDTLHIGPADLALISSISVIPWVIKPIYGFISDGFPLFGYKRRSYLILSGLTGALAWLGVAGLASCTMSGACPTSDMTTYATIGLVTLSSLGLAFSDVLVDAIVVGKSREIKSNAGALQSLCWSSSAMGSVISSYFSGSLVQQFGPKFVFAVTAAFPLITAGVAGLINEKPVNQVASDGGSSAIPAEEMPSDNFVEHVKEQSALLWKAFSQKSILLPVIFLMLWQSTPTSGSALFYFETNELGFQPEFLGRLSLVSAIASLFGTVLYDQKFKNVPQRTLFAWIAILGTVLGMTPLILVLHLNRMVGLPDQWFAIGDDVILTVLGQVAFMPVLVLGAKLCPEGVEASLYAALMSINNLSGGIGNIVGGLATKTMGVTESDFSNLPWLIFLTNISGLLPLAFLNLLPGEEEVVKESSEVVASEPEPVLSEKE